MSLFKKNGKEEVAPVMQEYTGQHPVLNLKVSAIVTPDHLDQYMEVHPFTSSEGKLNVKGDDGFLKKYKFKRDQQDEATLKKIILENKLSGLFFSANPTTTRRTRLKNTKVYWYFVPISDQKVDETVDKLRSVMEGFDTIMEKKRAMMIPQYFEDNKDKFDWHGNTVQVIKNYKGYSVKGTFFD